MRDDDRVNILLVDDQPGKLLTYEAILHQLGENLIRAGSGREALEHLLRSDVAVILIDVCMPDLDGFQLAAMIREHPRFQKTAIIFISAIHLSDMDRLRGYEMGAVDYVPVPVVAEVLRAKVRVFCELYRKTRQLETLNLELERRVAERTAELEAAASKLRQSERGRSLALAAGNMGSWEWDRTSDQYVWDEGQYRIFGVDPDTFKLSTANIRQLIDPDDWINIQVALERLIAQGENLHNEFRVIRPDGEVRWCIGVAAGVEQHGHRICGVTIDITDSKKAEEKQALLAREVDHRAKNALALVQSIVRLTRAKDKSTYVAAVEGRIRALSMAHNVLAQSRWLGANLRGLIEEELAPYDLLRIQLSGPDVLLQPAAAQTLALALHELATNAAKYGSLSSGDGRLSLRWAANGSELELTWEEFNGPAVNEPTVQGFGSRIIKASVERQLGGRVQFDWKQNGLKCEMFISNRDGCLFAVSNGRMARTRDDEATEEQLQLKGNRILVVEDEPLVALALAETLDECGFEVVGPCSSIAEAMIAARADNFDAAILDVNLKGEMIYAAAEILAARKIPFVFVTGYGPESIDSRFKHVIAMHKPIERERLGRLFKSGRRSDRTKLRSAV